MMVEPVRSGSLSRPSDDSGSPAETPVTGSTTDAEPSTDIAPPSAATASISTGPNGGRPSPADGALEDSRRRPSLSPSRAADFKTCPLLYRLRSIDRIAEAPTPDQLRGTLVHAVLEKLFDLPADDRTPVTAAALVTPQWERLLTDVPELAGVVPDADLAEFLSSTHGLLAGYFAMEDPRRLAPAEREYLVSAEVDDGRLQLRGYIDRLDVAPDGAIRVVDYKTGGAPREAFEARALFQLKFYALVLWRTRGVVPAVLRLVYLKDTEICDFTPDAEELERFERTLIALWAAIARAREAREFQPKPSRLCAWCAHQARCPEFGGTPPPYPEDAELDMALAAASVALEPAD
jgi:putative RecB family exonuclease